MALSMRLSSLSSLQGGRDSSMQPRNPFLQPQSNLWCNRSKTTFVEQTSICRQDLYTVRGTLAPSRQPRNGGDNSCPSPEICAVDQSSSYLQQLDLEKTYASPSVQHLLRDETATAATESNPQAPFEFCRKRRVGRRFPKPSVQQNGKRNSVFKSFATQFCNGLENMIRQTEKTPSHAHPGQSLMNGQTYFAPIPDETPLFTDLEVVGNLPECMNGVYLRTGPNPQMDPSGGYCFFDGDGMLHSVRMKDGKASYCARYVRTSRFKQERAARQPLFIKPFGELHGLSGLGRIGLLALRTALGVVDLSEGWGAANTGLTFFNNCLLAMSEDDLPYVIKVKEDGNVETVGRYDFEGQISGAMTSHPKVDPVTGEMFSISCNFAGAPYLRYFVVSPDGIRGPEVPINLKEPMIAHDFAVTENFAVLPDLDLVINMKNMMEGKSAIAFDKQKTARLGVLPRYATSDEGIQWFELPQESFCFHYWTAWEDGDEIVLTGSILVPADKFFTSNRLELRYELTEFRLNRATGLASKRVLVPDLNLESGQINQRLYGRKCRFVYLAIMEPLPTWVKVAGVTKIDLEAAPAVNSATVASSVSSGPVVGIRHFTDEGCLGSEPFFVPRTSDPDAAEDDGYVVTYVHHQTTGLSELVIMDAQSPTLETVASVKLPSRVPYGLHGIFVNEEQLSKQI
ncbi:hypothetical protein R1flu_005548 [Riccia fluitans]|uniref:9-cis-epoxycarotenoid dioxygenase n=1 Tax=Riccia fluitans TaxID=41844 RepID=A0ABD1YTH0_9MARC